MNSIPFLKQPELQELLKCSNIPCYDEMKRIVLVETERNNKILLAGDAACHPSETYVIIDFDGGPKSSYENLKSSSCKAGTYQYLVYSDNNGALQINFGRIAQIEFGGGLYERFQYRRNKFNERI